MALNRSKLYILDDQVRDSVLYCAGKKELVYADLKMVARKPRIAGRDFEQSGCGFLQDFEQSGCGFLQDSVPVLKAQKMTADIF